MHTMREKEAEWRYRRLCYRYVPYKMMLAVFAIKDDTSGMFDKR